MRAVTLMYHDVVTRDDPTASGFADQDAFVYKVAPGEFERHLAALSSSAGRQPATVFDLASGIPGDLPFLMTFDDGGVSAYTFIADRLERNGWRGHFFVATDRIGDPAFLSRDQVRELARRGHVIGTHSCSHPTRMSACSWEQLLREWSASAARLADIIGQKVRVGSLPGGYYSRHVARAAALAGIEALFTSEPTIRSRGVDGCLVLGRYTVRRGMGPGTVAALARGQRLARLRQQLVWTAKRIPKALGGRYYVDVRKSLLALEERDATSPPGTIPGSLGPEPR